MISLRQTIHLAAFFISGLTSLATDMVWCSIKERLKSLQSWLQSLSQSCVIIFWASRQIFGKSKGQYCSPIYESLIKTSISQGRKQLFCALCDQQRCCLSNVSSLKCYAIKISWFFLGALDAQYSEVILFLNRYLCQVCSFTLEIMQ